ncbi:hypothetical protein KCU93_g412, partial [Aureobasidium melanogenum]
MEKLQEEGATLPSAAPTSLLFLNLRVRCTSFKVKPCAQRIYISHTYRTVRIAQQPLSTLPDSNGNRILVLGRLVGRRVVAVRNNENALDRIKCNFSSSVKGEEAIGVGPFLQATVSGRFVGGTSGILDSICGGSRHVGASRGGLQAEEKGRHHVRDLICVVDMLCEIDNALTQAILAFRWYHSGWVEWCQAVE